MQKLLTCAVLALFVGTCLPQPVGAKRKRHGSTSEVPAIAAKTPAPPKATKDLRDPADIALETKSRAFAAAVKCEMAAQQVSRNDSVRCRIAVRRVPRNTADGGPGFMRHPCGAGVVSSLNEHRFGTTPVAACFCATGASIKVYTAVALPRRLLAAARNGPVLLMVGHLPSMTMRA